MRKGMICLTLKLQLKLTKTLKVGSLHLSVVPGTRISSTTKPTFIPKKSLFTVPTVNSVTYGERVFSFRAPTLWNTLPDSLKNAVSLSSS